VLLSISPRRAATFLVLLTHTIPEYDTQGYTFPGCRANLGIVLDDAL